jgi:hypothetical protein
MGNFYFIIVLEYTYMYLKTTNLIGFHHIYEIVFINSNKKHYHLNLKTLLNTRCLLVAVKIKNYALNSGIKAQKYINIS